MISLVANRTIAETGIIAMRLTTNSIKEPLRVKWRAVLKESSRTDSTNTRGCENLPSEALMTFDNGDSIIFRRSPLRTSLSL